MPKMNFSSKVVHTSIFQVAQQYSHFPQNSIRKLGSSHSSHFSRSLLTSCLGFEQEQLPIVGRRCPGRTIDA